MKKVQAHPTARPQPPGLVMLSLGAGHGGGGPGKAGSCRGSTDIPLKNVNKREHTFK